MDVNRLRLCATPVRSVMPYMVDWCVRYSRTSGLCCLRLIDESEGVEARSATEVYTELQATYLKNIPCALLHGRLKNQEKKKL